MRSGYDSYDGIWGNPYYDDQFAEITDRDFVQKTFHAGDALVSLRSLDRNEVPESRAARWYQDGTVEVPYTGQEFDATKFTLGKSRWSHEHCCVCEFSIREGNTFWANPDGTILCDECHDHYVIQGNAH